MWTFESTTGLVFDLNNNPVAVGYAGHGDGVNNPLLQNVKDVGPLPEGLYSMGPLQDHGELGKDVIQLIPHDENEMYGRSGFFIHGDEILHPNEHLASDGCMIVNHAGRLLMGQSNDHVLRVVAVHNFQGTLALT